MDPLKDDTAERGRLGPRGESDDVKFDAGSHDDSASTSTSTSASVSTSASRDRFGDWRLRMMVRLQMLPNDVRNAIMRSDLLDRWSVIGSAVLFWIFCDLAIQVIIVYAASGIWWLALGGRTPPTLRSGFVTDPQVAALFALTAPLASILAFIPVLVASPFIRARWKGSPIMRWRRIHGRSIWTALLGVGSGVGLFAVLQLLSYALRLIGLGSDSATMSTSTVVWLIGRLGAGWSVWSVWTVLTMLAMVTIVPFLEEVLFRVVIAGEICHAGNDAGNDVGNDAGGLARGFRVIMRMVGSCALSGLLFALVHIPGEPRDQWLGIIVCMMVLGGALTWMTQYKALSVWPAAIAHMTYNAVTMLALLTIVL